MTQVLAQMKDSNANISKFKSKFHGENNNTIRFIFDIQQYDRITTFADPNTLFRNIYCALPEWIQTDFAIDKTQVLSTKWTALDENATFTEQQQAKIYTVKDMQSFFVKNFRPTVKRGQIFAVLKSIRHRYNENPRNVVSRLHTALNYASKTIKLMNETGTEQIQRISDDDITELLAHVFCIKNNNTVDRNNGGINKLMQRKVREKKQQYTEQQGLAPYYKIAEDIGEDIGGLWYSKSKEYRLEYYHPWPLPLWETITKQQQNPYKPIQKQLNPNSQRGIKRPQRPTPQTPRGPPHKRQKYGRPNYPNPRNPRNPNRQQYPPHNPSRQELNIQCYRCGFKGHRWQECKARRDKHNNTFGFHDRRIKKHMPYNPDYKPPRNPKANPNINQNANPNQPRPKYGPRNNNPNNNRGWNRYGKPQQQPPYNKGNNTSNRGNPNPSNNNQQQQNRGNSQSSLFSLIAPLIDYKNQNTHLDPDILHTIETLQQQCSNGNNDDDHDNSNEPQPRQSYQS